MRKKLEKIKEGAKEFLRALKEIFTLKNSCKEQNFIFLFPNTPIKLCHE